MGNVIVTIVLLIFFIGLLSLLIDCLYITNKQEQFTSKKKEPDVTVILQENFEIDLNNIYK